MTKEEECGGRVTWKITMESHNCFYLTGPESSHLIPGRPDLYCMEPTVKGQMRCNPEDCPLKDNSANIPDTPLKKKKVKSK